MRVAPACDQSSREDGRLRHDDATLLAARDRPVGNVLPNPDPGGMATW